MAILRDTTGRPGPAAWKHGMYPEGEAEYPVTGVSWYEAAAYAVSVGKRLPSIHHWRHAAGCYMADFIVPLSNLGRRGPAAVASHDGMSPYGAYDMAGNVKEWCTNEAAEGKRYIMGGAWHEPDYALTGRDAQPPLDRSSTHGFRCLKLIGRKPVAAEVDAPRISVVRDYAEEKPASDAEFEIYKRMFSYDRTNLETVLEGVDDSDARWRKERVSFTTAYNNERMAAFIFIPRNARQPYQTVIYFPGAGAQFQRSSETLSDAWVFHPLVENGRAVVYPVYKGTYERVPATPVSGRVHFRDSRIRLSQDLGRTIDYLETRADIQVNKLAYLGFSWGAGLGAMLPAIESRLKVNVLVVGGFWSGRPLPEVDPINFAPRVTIPTLMLNGRFDFSFPLNELQRPMFRWLGASAEHKRHVIYETGHTVPHNQSAVEILAWLDRYLGPVK
jgi:eukaryotic-like serine/threonine-protein kinase